MPNMFYPDGEQTTVTPTAPDVYYIRTREDLLLYEDVRFNSLIQAVPNYYIVENDQSVWGDFIRAISQELARFEYGYAYDVVNKDPIFLTPPDIQRRYAAPLYINRFYPTKDPVQYDLDYKMMLVNLIPAYFQGATVSSLEAIITAYTGLHIGVLELYKFIGQGFFDQSDRNAISVSVNVGGNNPLDDIQQLNQLQAITNALYGAIDLGKPAHVGLEFKTVFGSGEDIHSFVSQGTSIPYDIVNPNGITDLLRIFIRIVEAEPFSPMLYQAPALFAGTPRTGLGPSQVLAWQPKTAYVEGQIILSGTHFQVVTTGGTSGNGPASPVFNPTLHATTTDNTVTWTNEGTALGVTLYPANNTHNPGVVFPIFSTIIDPNGFVQVASVGGTSFPAWVQSHTYLFAQEIIDANGFIQQITTSGVSGASSFPSNLYYPPFNETINAHTDDGSAIWQTQGLFTWNTELGGVTIDGSVVWVNLGTPPGLVAPRLARAWEIKSDQLSTFEVS
jgi:hypothetical protein